MATLARLSSPTAFRSVFSTGRSYARGSIVIYVAKRSEGGPARAGYVVSRKVGGAVARNRAKRLIREAFRLCRDELPPAIDLVIIANASTPGRKLAELQRELGRVRRDLRRLFGPG
jgi:ribonuclease P protein component